MKNYGDINFQLKDSIQLPQCPLCIERLDVGVSGLSTLTSSDIIGYIYAHNTKGWLDCEASCKICKTLNPMQSGSLPIPLICHCGVKESIWICLICGFLGCGRYQNAHASKHFMETGHCFAVDTESGRIWNYLEDGYAHRILKTNVIGPIDPGIEEFSTPGGPEELTDKIENTLSEYNHLLTAQLEDQREYFEEKLKNYKKAFEETPEMKEINEKLACLNKEIEEAKIKRKKLKKENANILKENENLQKSIQKTEQDILLDTEISKNLKSQIAECSKDEKTEKEEKINVAIEKRQKILAELEKELANLYSEIK